MDEKLLKTILWSGLGLIIALPLATLILIGFFQGLSGVKDWLIPISGFVSLITIAIGSWLAVNNYLLKLKLKKDKAIRPILNPISGC